MSTADALIADRYRLVRLLGSGGMGVVWEAWDERLHRRVALKQLRPQPGLSPEEVELTNHRALREARINARLHHRYAVPVFDVVEHHGQPCLIMQFVSSVPLSQVLREGGPLQPAEAAQVGAQVGSALAEAHQAGIVHRDIKPGNILIADDGTALISDFGISHAMGDVTLTQTGMVHGTPAYLAPEVARGGTASFASDVFSLGATLYAALEGGPPFGTDLNSIALLFRVAAGTFDEPRRSGPVAPVLVEMLAADPQARPDMATVARRLAALATSEPGPHRSEAEGGSAAGSAPDPTPESLRTTRVAARAEPAPDDATEVDQRTTVARSESAAPTLLAADAATPRRTVPAAGGPPARIDAPVDPPRRRRNRLLAAAAAILIVAGLITGLVLAANRSGTNTAGPSPSAAQSETTAASTDPTPSASPSPSDEPSTTPTPSRTASPTPRATPRATPSPTPSASTSASGTPTAAELAAAVTSYYAKVPGDRDAAWSLLTSKYQRRAGGRSSYDRFWSDFSKVSASGVSGNPPGGAQATLTYTYKSGRVVKERTSFQLVRDDGVLKINSSAVQQSN